MYRVQNVPKRMGKNVPGTKLPTNFMGMGQNVPGTKLPYQKIKKFVKNIYTFS